MNVSYVRSIQKTPYEVVFGSKPNIQGVKLPDVYLEKNPLINFSISTPQMEDINDVEMRDEDGNN